LPSVQNLLALGTLCREFIIGFVHSPSRKRAPARRPGCSLFSRSRRIGLSRSIGSDVTDSAVASRDRKTGEKLAKEMAALGSFRSRHGSRKARRAEIDGRLKTKNQV
jgi:hypothetical protein